MCRIGIIINEFFVTSCHHRFFYISLILCPRIKKFFESYEKHDFRLELLCKVSIYLFLLFFFGKRVKTWKHLVTFVIKMQTKMFKMAQPSPTTKLNKYNILIFYVILHDKIIVNFIMAMGGGCDEFSIKILPKK